MKQAPDPKWGRLATFGCNVAVLLGIIATLWMLFSPSARELSVLSLWAASVVCQFKVGKMVSDEGVADIVTALILTVFLTPILYVCGWLYADDWNCRPLMFVWTAAIAGLACSVLLFF